MKTFFKLFLTVALLTGSIGAFAQSTSNVYMNIDGLSLKEMKPADVEGSAFLIDDWTKATVTTNKAVYSDVKVKYDIYNDQLIFAGANDEPRAFADPVKQFTLNNANYANGFPAIGAQSAQSYYQVLADGKVKLLKHQAKIIRDNKTYGAASVTRDFKSVETYFIFQNGKMQSFKPDKKETAAVLSDKAAQISSYLASHKVNYKNDADLSALFSYYNTL